MHIFFSGIGGTGIGPLALIAKEAGFKVSGSDKQDSSYIHYLQDHGVDRVNIGQDRENIENLHKKSPIDWYVYSSAVVKEIPDLPELQFAREQGIKTSKRDELLNLILKEKNLKLIAVAGTHGKTTTTAMAVWLFKQLNIPISYSVGAKLPFGDMGEYAVGSEYFIYEADEYDRNFLAFHPFLSIIPGIDWDHADVYPTREDYYQAFRDFLGQCEKKIVWQSDMDRIGLSTDPTYTVLSEDSSGLDGLTLVGLVNRQNALQVINAAHQLTGHSIDELTAHMNRFPGISRRFEKIANNIYSDYAHTPEKIRGAIQVAKEQAGDNVVVIYEGLHNTRQHFIKGDLKHLFDDVKKLYIVPSYLAREDKSLELLTPEKLIGLLASPKKALPKQLDNDLKQTIVGHVKAGDLVLCLSAGGGNSLDEWIRKESAQ